MLVTCVSRSYPKILLLFFVVTDWSCNWLQLFFDQKVSWICQSFLIKELSQYIWTFFSNEHETLLGNELETFWIISTEYFSVISNVHETFLSNENGMFLINEHGHFLNNEREIFLSNEHETFLSNELEKCWVISIFE